MVQIIIWDNADNGVTFSNTQINTFTGGQCKATNAYAEINPIYLKEDLFSILGVRKQVYLIRQFRYPVTLRRKTIQLVYNCSVQINETYFQVITFWKETLA